MNFDNINLIRNEKRALFSFHFRKRQTREQIDRYDCFDSLYHTYRFLKENYLREQSDRFGAPAHDGTYSLSTEYLRYREYLRKKRIESLPNWVAILVSLLGVVINLLLVWLQFHIAGLI